MDINEFKKLKHDFETFSNNVSRKQESLSTKHKAMQKERAKFKERINKRMNY